MKYVVATLLLAAVIAAPTLGQGATLTYSTYFGGTNLENNGARVPQIAVDTAGNMIVVSSTLSNDLPTTPGVVQPTFRGGVSDAFVVKFNSSGALVFATYLGGTGFDHPNSVDVDAAGNIYVTGYTTSTNFPTVNPLQSFRGAEDGFVTKLNPTGTTILYSTFLGGTSFDQANDLAVDAAGNVYVIGDTISADFPVVNPLQSTLSGFRDLFVTKIDASGSTVIYSTFFGGSGTEDGDGIAIDLSGNAYLVGGTDSTDFPTTPGAFQTSLAGPRDAFVTKLNPAGSSLVYSTYLGGTVDETEDRNDIKVDSSGQAHVAGITSSPDFPTVNAIQPTGGVSDVFVTKFDSTGSSLIYSTYLGGATSGEQGVGIDLDPAGNLAVTGGTGGGSGDFPVVNGLPSSMARGNGEAFVTVFGPSGTFLYSTLLGGSVGEAGYDVASDAQGNVHVAGSTTSSDFPLVNPADSTFGGAADVFVAKISMPVTLNPTITLSPGTQSIVVGSTGTLTLNISAAQTTDTIVALSSSDAAVASVPPSVTIPANVTSATFTVTGLSAGGPVTITATLPAALGSGTATATVDVTNPQPAITTINPATVAEDGAGFTLTVDGSGFVAGSVVNVNGSPRATTFVSTTQLTAAILASDIVTPGSLTITVTSPAPGGGTSNPATLVVTAAATAIPTLNWLGLLLLIAALAVAAMMALPKMT